MSLISVLSLFSCCMLSEFASFVATETMYGEKVYHNGPYQFHGCTPERGDAITDLFKTSGSIITNDIIPELESPTFPDSFQDPFFIFFSSNRRRSIARVYQAIVDAPAPRPTIICIKGRDGDPLLAERLAACTASISKPYGPTQALTAFYDNGMIEIILCPIFFQHYPAFPGAEDCPVVNVTDTRYWSRDGFQYSSQFSIIVHELVHVYSRYNVPYWRENYALNSLTYLSPAMQLANSENYAAFATCKSSVDFVK